MSYTEFSPSLTGAKAPFFKELEVVLISNLYKSLKREVLSYMRIGLDIDQACKRVSYNRIGRHDKTITKIKNELKKDI